MPLVELGPELLLGFAPMSPNLNLAELVGER
jgi:hypothetical protein